MLKKWQFRTQKMQILDAQKYKFVLKIINSALRECKFADKKYSGALNRPPKFCAQKWKFSQ